MVSAPARWGLQFDVSPVQAGVDQIAPSIAALGPSGNQTGRFVIVWGQHFDGAGVGDAAGVVAQLYNGDGTKRGGPFLVNSTTNSIQNSPDVVERVDDQGFAVVWADSSRQLSGFGTDVRMRLFGVNGSAQGNDFIVHQADVLNNEIQPSIDRIGTFGTIFVGYDNLFPPDAGEGDINDGVRGRAFSNANPLQDDFAVTTADPHAGETNSQGQVHVADLPQTGFLVTWTDDLSGGQIFGSGSAIRGRSYSQLGAAVGEEFDIATNDGRVLRDPAAAGLPNGKFVVAWTQDDSGPDGGFENNVYARIFGPAGKGGDPFLLHEGTAGQQTTVALEAFGPNRFIAAWTDQTGIKFTIRARIFNGDGTPWSDEFIVNTEDGTAPRFPSIAVLQEATGPRFVISWVGNEGTLKAQIFDPVRGAMGIDFFGSERGEAYAAQLGEHVLAGNGGDDALTGSAGKDTLSGGLGRDSLAAGAGGDLANGGAGNDVLAAAAGNDRLLGDEGNDTLDGGAGNDTATGGNGNDSILGNAGNDTLGGEAGADTLLGGPGADRLTGGLGPDRFDFNAAGHSAPGARDTVGGFSALQGDRIDLATIDADPDAPGNQAFAFITTPFTGAGGEVRFTTANGNGLLAADLDGDRAADFSLLLLDVTTLGAGALIL